MPSDFAGAAGHAATLTYITNPKPLQIIDLVVLNFDSWLEFFCEKGTNIWWFVLATVMSPTDL